MNGPPGFVPLALQLDWILERGWGWRVLADDLDLKLLVRSRGPGRAFLLLVRRAEPEALARALVAHGALSFRARATLVDFSGALVPQPAPATLSLAGTNWRRAAEGRFFGVGTFVVDLARPEEELWGRVAAGKRKEMRRAERQGLVACCRPAQPDDIAAFVRWHGPQARARALPAAPRSWLERLAGEGSLLASSVCAGDGRPLVVHLLYLGHDQGYYLYGSGVPQPPDGAGLLAQWAGVRALQARGLRFYDLGLVSSTAAEDGRYRFKRSLGGDFVAYGEEYRHASRAWAWLAALRRPGARRA